MDVPKEEDMNLIEDSNSNNSRKNNLNKIWKINGLFKKD